MISIVMPYINRKVQLIRTLKSIQNSAVRDFEIIIVDDASNKAERIEDLQDEFTLKILRVNKMDKWYTSPAMALNRGIANAHGDIIVLQNPECLHVHDVLSEIVKNVNETNYVSISTYSINQEQTEKLDSVNIHEFFKLMSQQIVVDFVGWYNHSVYRPVHYNFCAALTMGNMEKLGGFDERYAMGIAYEDNEFIDRINKMGLKKIILDNVSVIHQWHEKVYDLLIEEHMILFERNAHLYDDTRHESIYHVENRYR